MKNIPISKLVPGMVTASDILSGDGRKLVLPKGSILTDNSIIKLEFYSVLSVAIEDGTDNETAYIPEPPSYSDRVQGSIQFHRFSENYNNDISLFESQLNDIVKKNAPIDVDVMMENITNLLESEDGYINIFDMLSNLRSYDDATYAHGVNVALICNVFANWLHLTPEQKNTATLCGLLHDVGKLMIPEEILKKPDALTPEEYKIIQTHPLMGYEKLKQSNVEMDICNAALMHHERYDGSGYPMGLSGEQISMYASIVSIADVYDAMTAARVYRGPLCPFQVISLFESEGLQRYSPRYVMTFLENIVNTYISYTVRLSNGQKGKIAFINKDKLSRPTIQVGDKYIDLAKMPEVTITRII